MMGSLGGFSSRPRDGMRNYRNADACIAAWLRGEENGKSGSRGNVFFIGSTIYSYGTHFPMARFIDKAVLVTIDRYGATTGKHLYDVRRALNREQHDVFNVLYVEGNRHSDNAENYAKRLAELVRKAARARKYREYLERNADALRNEACLYARRFGLNVRFAVPQFDETTRLANVLAGGVPAKSLRDVQPEHVLVREAA
jgi:hypothetical protein